MKLTPAIQEALLSVLIYQAHAAPLVRSLLQPNVFDPYYREIVTEVYGYLEQYGKPPGEHAQDIFDALRARHEDRSEIYSRIWESIEAGHETLNAAYVIDQATLFAKHQRLRRAVANAAQALNAPDASGVARAEQQLQEALEVRHGVADYGTKLTDTRALRFLRDPSIDAFPTGIKELDAAGVGPARSGLHILAALAGKGKSWWLVQLARHALMSRLRVCYVTLEMPEDQVLKRIFQSLFSVSARSVGGAIQHYSFKRDELGRFIGLRERALRQRPSMEDEKIHAFLTERIKRLRTRPPLIVKQFPTSTLTVRDLEAYLKALESVHHFMPDLLIVDYPDLMAIDAKNYRIDTGQVYKQLRGLAMRRNMACAVVSQLNRAAHKARQATGYHIAEDVSKLMTADTVITYSQTDAEYELRLARLLVVKARNQESQFTVLLSQDYRLGQFSVDSARFVSSYWSRLQTMNGSDEEAEDDGSSA